MQKFLNADVNGDKVLDTLDSTCHRQPLPRQVSLSKTAALPGRAGAAILISRKKNAPERRVLRVMGAIGPVSRVLS